jgi:hypothetical protein
LFADVGADLFSVFQAFLSAFIGCARRSLADLVRWKELTM